MRYFIFILLLSGCLNLDDGAKSTLIKESGNAGRSKKAVLFLRESGATVADSYQVSVKDYDQTLEDAETGNAFTVDDDHGKRGLDSSAVDLFWISNDTLEIKYDKKLRTFIKNEVVNGVVILYRMN